MDDAFATLRKIIFSNKTIDDTDTSSDPKVTFELKREFNDLSAFLIYKFVGELTDQFSISALVPIQIQGDEEKITVKLKLPEGPNDYLGRDFRTMVKNDPAYLEIMHNFDASIINLENFPALTPPEL